MSSPVSPPLSPTFSDYLDFDLDDVDSNIYSFLLQATTNTIQIKKQHIQNKFNLKKSEIQKQILEKKANLKKKLRDSKTVRFRDKIAFVLGVSLIWISTIFMFVVPHYMVYYYSIMAVSLISLRYSLYKPRAWHYFTADLCYQVNGLTLLFLFFFQDSTWVFTAVFFLANGPVLVAIYAWRNSLVFHSLDKITSVWIHYSPALCLYTIRWLSGKYGRINDIEKLKVFLMENNSTIPGLPYPKFAYDELNPTSSVELSFRSSMFISTCVYSLWQLGYYYLIMVRQKDKVESGTRATSYSWLLADYMKNKKDSALTKLFLKFDAKWHKWLYMFFQFIYAIITSLPVILMYRSFWFHTGFLIFIFMMSVFNGGDYYIEVFSRRYRSELKKLEESITVEESLLEATFGCSSRLGKSENPTDNKGGTQESTDSLDQNPISVKDMFKKD